MKKRFLGIGIGPGIGFAAAMKFALEGYQPVLASRSKKKLAPLAEEIHKTSGLSVETVEFDAGDINAYGPLAEKYGQNLDVLFFNAAVMRPQRIENMSFESMDEDIRVNLTAAIAATKAFSPKMIKRGSGSILLTGGGLALSPLPDFLTLSIGKAGIRCLSQALFNDFADSGVHIASLTITKNIEPQSAGSQAIAEAFWKIHQQAKENWTCEEQY